MTDEKLSERLRVWESDLRTDGDFTNLLQVQGIIEEVEVLEGILDRVKTTATELEATPLTSTPQGNAYAMGLKTAGRKITLVMTLTPMKGGSA